MSRINIFFTGARPDHSPVQTFNSDLSYVLIRNLFALKELLDNDAVPVCRDLHLAGTFRAS